VTLPRPLVTEHGADDLLLDLVVAADHGGDPRGRDDRDFVGVDQLHAAAIVVGVSVGDQHLAQGLVEILGSLAQRRSIRDRQRAVHHHHAAWGLDQVCVDRHR
jgi:hypothetical protein